MRKLRKCKPYVYQEAVIQGRLRDSSTVFREGLAPRRVRDNSFVFQEDVFVATTRCGAIAPEDFDSDAGLLTGQPIGLLLALTYA